MPSGVGPVQGHHGEMGDMTLLGWWVIGPEMSQEMYDATRAEWLVGGGSYHPWDMSDMGQDG